MIAPVLVLSFLISAFTAASPTFNLTSFSPTTNDYYQDCYDAAQRLPADLPGFPLPTRFNREIQPDRYALPKSVHWKDCSLLVLFKRRVSYDLCSWAIIKQTYRDMVEVSREQERTSIRKYVGNNGGIELWMYKPAQVLGDDLKFDASNAKS